MLQVENIEKYYGNGTGVTKALCRISFRVEDGEFIAIMGASGSGKTTLLNCISTIDTISAGRICLDGIDVSALSSAELARFRREKLGFVFQDFNLLDTLTIEENIGLALSLTHTEPAAVQKQVQDVAQKLGIADILPKFRGEFPQVEFSLYEGNSTQLEDELSHGRADLIICFQPIIMEGVAAIPLTEQRLVMVVPRTFTDQLFGPQAEEVRRQYAQGADIQAFEHLPFVLIKRGNRTRNIVDQYFSRYYFKPQLILETENTVTTLAMAQAGVGITICPELFLRAIPTPPHDSEGVDLFPLTDPSTFSKLVAGYRKSRYLSHFGQRFIEITQDILEE